MSGPGSKNILRRDTLVNMLRAALESGEIRFARQAALAWLAAFPGDLEVILLQARTILSTNRKDSTIPLVEQACRKDPFDVQAWRMLAEISKDDPNRREYALTCLFALSDPIANGRALLEWGLPLRMAFSAYQSGQHVEAERWIQETMHHAPDLLMAAVLHLLVDRAVHDAPSTLHLAKIYHERWPECLPISLVLAEALLEMGSEPEAVHLLHQCAAADAAGQTAKRLWGEEHLYRAIWPDEMVIYFNQPIPAAVLSALGNNNLTAGLPKLLLESGMEVADETAESPELSVEANESDASEQVDTGDQAGPDIENTTEPALVAEGTGDAPGTDGTQTVGKGKGKKRDRKAIEEEFEELARKLKQPELARMDGRYPVYVILSSREGITGQYGPQTAGILDLELRRLAGLISHKHGWGALVLYADDADSLARFNLTPVNPRDPWKVKRLLAELDSALGKHGERIGSLLIIGGDQIIPFHRLPNPVEDGDGDIPSDSPYGSLDANYFIPEWPVGRLPGEEGPDAGLLLEQIRQILRYHGRRSHGSAFFGLDWLAWFKRMFARILPKRSKPNFGYTAAVWRRSSLAVFRPIGAPHTVLASPPEESGSFQPERALAANLGYYNLHGLPDSPSWYGQRDPLEKGEFADYPVAVSPADLRRNGHAPRVVFSEACYGGHVTGKTESDSLALKFLSIGTLGVVASTCVSYGSVNTPLIAADLLGNLFWQHLKGGRTVGEALMAAKVDLVREMNNRQGYLDSEDQKTLISFVLYGDPLAGYESHRIQRKGMIRVKELQDVKTVSDGPEEPLSALPAATLKQVKGIVAEYLPGAGLDEIHLSMQKNEGNGANGAEAKSSRRRKSPGRKSGTGSSTRMVVTVSKQVKTMQHIHKHYMRVTLDESGKTVKLAISR